MNVVITGRKMNITEALRSYTEEKMTNAVKVFDIDPITIDVVLRLEDNRSEATRQICEVTVRARGHVVRVSESDSDMYAAIDKASEKIARQLRKFKTKIVDRRQRAGRVTEEVVPVSEPDFGALAEELSAETEDDELVREKVIDFTVMTEEQALVQTDLIGHDFFVFTNEETGAVNVIYRRHNGGYGIIKPNLEAPEAEEE